MSRSSSAGTRCAGSTRRHGAWGSPRTPSWRVPVQRSPSWPSPSWPRCGRRSVGRVGGGDGFVAARRLTAAGRRTTAVLVGDPARLAGVAAAHNWGVLQAMASAGSLELYVAPTPELLLQLRARLSPASLIVDALLGSGASGPLREPVSSAVDLLNAIRTHARAAGRPCRVLAVDTPTRIDLTDGTQSDPVVVADLTVTFHRAKAGFALDPEARRLAGRYFVGPIGIPLEAEDGIVPPDGEFPPARITQVTWQEPGGAPS
ncbi:MAG: hypothetical protein E6J47_08235 [Chloroflexi bacterium]|nr:MAG: hypothetical protein E6J47_08235 [Chloroflexota bacterium]